MQVGAQIILQEPKIEALLCMYSGYESILEQSPHVTNYGSKYIVRRR